MIECQPLFELLFIKFAKLLVAGGGLEHTQAELMRLTFTLNPRVDIYIDNNTALCLKVLNILAGSSLPSKRHV